MRLSTEPITPAAVHACLGWNRNSAHNTHTHNHTHAQIQTQMHLCTHDHMHRDAHTKLFTQIHKNIHRHINMLTYKGTDTETIYAYTHVYTCAQTQTHVHKCINQGLSKETEPTVCV